MNSHPDAQMPVKSIRTLLDIMLERTLSTDQCAVLRRALLRNHNIVIAGPHGSGRTTLVGALLREVEQLRRSEAVVVIDESGELDIDSVRIRHLISRFWSDPTGQTVYRHLEDCLRVRPDRVVLGDLRGSETDLLINVWAECAGGGITVTHGASAEDTLRRLVLNMGGEGAKKLARTLDVVVVMSRTAAGIRVREIAHVSGHSGNTVTFQSTQH